MLLAYASCAMLRPLPDCDPPCRALQGCWLTVGVRDGDYANV